MKKRDNAGKRAFFCSLGLSLSFLLAAAGIVTVDYRGRQLSFGDSQPPFFVEDKPGGKKELEIRLLGLDKRVDITKLDEFWDFLCDFGCIPHN